MESKRQSKTTVPYTLFLYREELRRRDARFLRLSNTKINLTDKLISKKTRQLHECSVEDLQAISREMTFRRQLKWQVSRLRQLEQLGLWNVDPNAMTTEL